MHDEKEAATSDLTGNEPDTTREAFMAAIIKLADDEAFRKAFLEHYQRWAHPPMMLVPELVGLDPPFNTTPGGITWVNPDLYCYGGGRGA